MSNQSLKRYFRSSPNPKVTPNETEMLHEALGITALVGYRSETGKTLSLCKAARVSYPQLLAAASINNWFYKKLQRHRIMYAAWTGNLPWFTTLFRIGNQNGMMNVLTTRNRNLYHILSMVPQFRGLTLDPKIPARVAMFKLLLEHNNPGLDGKDCDGNTPFLLAIKYGLVELVNEYLFHTDKFDIHHANTVDKNNPFHMAAEIDNTAIITRLWDTSIDINKVNTHNCTPLEIAVECGHAAVVSKLLGYYPHHVRIRRETSTVFCRAVGENYLQIVKLMAPLTEIDLNCKEGHMDATALITAADAGFVEIVEELLKYYPQRLRINARDDDNNSALYYAVHGNHTKVVKALCRCDTLNLGLLEDHDSPYNLAHNQDPAQPEILQEFDKFKERVAALPLVSHLTTTEILLRLHKYDHLLDSNLFHLNYNRVMESDTDKERNPMYNLLYSRLKSGKISAEQFFEDTGFGFSKSLLENLDKI